MSVDVESAQGVSVELLGRECYVPGDARRGVWHSMSAQGVPLVRYYADGPLAEAAGAMALPVVGEFVQIPGRAGMLRGYWAGVCAESPGGDRTQVRVVVGATLVEATLDFAELDASRIVTGQGSPEVVDAVRAAAELAERVHGERAAHEAWKQELSADACARADSEGYCAEFDVFMVSHGLEGRSRPYSVQCTVTGTVRVQVQASTSEQAEEQVSTEDVIDALNVHDLEWEVDSAYTF